MSAELGDFTKSKKTRKKIYGYQIPPRFRKKGGQNPICGPFPEFGDLDDVSSQGYVHIDKSMNEEVHALACCILSQCLACPTLRVAKTACGDGNLHACHQVPAGCSDDVRLAV